MNIVENILENITLLTESKNTLRLHLGLDESVPFNKYIDSIEYNPKELFKGGKQGVWYDPSDKSTLFQDVAGTVPVTKDGDPVALMRDKSGNGNHATQTISVYRPIYKTDGILHRIESRQGGWFDLNTSLGWLMDGSGSHLVAAWGNVRGDDKVAAGLLGNSELSSTPDGFDMLLDNRDNVAVNSFWHIQPADGLNARGVLNGAFSVSSNSLVYFQQDSVKNYWGSNRLGLISGSRVIVGTDNTRNVYLFAINAGIAYFNYQTPDFYGMIAVNDGTIDALNIKQYLAAKSGVTL